MRLTFSIPGVPQSKKRHRTVPLLYCPACSKNVQGQYRECTDCGGTLRFVKNLSYSDSESVKYENLVAYAAKQAMTNCTCGMFQGPVRMEMKFILPIPASRQCQKHYSGTEEVGGIYRRVDCRKLHELDPHSQRPDCDNMIKSVLDGLNGVAFADDSIISELTAKKIWGSAGSAEVEIEEL